MMKFTSIVEFNPNRPNDYTAGLRDVLGFLESCRDETEEWRRKHPLSVKFEQAYRDGQWTAIQLACTAVEQRIAEIESA